MNAKFRYWDSFNGVMIYSEKTHLADFFGDYELALYGDNNPVLMQFTGLQDKNGRDIYEGDKLLIEIYDHYSDKVIASGESIVSYKDCKFVASWKNDTVCLSSFHNSKFTVVGNIYETAETEKN